MNQTLIDEKNTLKKRNVEDQNTLYAQELALLEIDIQGSNYEADRYLPLWFRGIVSKITRKPDELVILQKINRCEYKIQNRLEELNKMDQRISELTPTKIYLEFVSQSLEDMIGDLRELRSNLGEEFKKLRNYWKRNQVKIDREQIIKTLSENIISMNRITSENTQEMASKLKQGLKAFDSYQKRSIGLPTANPFEISTVFDEIEEEEKND